MSRREPKPFGADPAAAGIGASSVLRTLMPDHLGGAMMVRRCCLAFPRSLAHAGVAALLAAFILVASPLAAAGLLPLPDTTGWTVWQAEEAEQEGAWVVGGPSGAGDRYLQPTAAGATLTFAFDADRPGTLRVRPIWWPTGEQKLSQRFPYPLVRQPGPDVLGAIGTTLFATAPATGRVVAVDAATEKVIGFTEVGGYLSDLVVDRDYGRLYVTDALGDRLVAIDAQTREVIGALRLPGSPWSLALHDGVLYVACRDARRLVAFSTATGDIVGEADLPAAPIALEFLGDPPTSLVVRFQQQPFDVFTLDPAPADRQQFVVEGESRAGKPRPGCGGPDCRCSWYEVEGPHRLSHGGSTGERKLVDVSTITKGPADPGIVSRFGDHPGPASPVLLKLGDPGTYFLFFASPSRGVIGVLDEESKPLGSIKVGGYLSDLMPVGDKVYAADAAGDRVVVLDAKTRTVEAEIAVPGHPWGLAAVADVAWQRRDPEMWPPVEVNRLYVTCTGTNDLAAVDLATRKVVKRVPLQGEPRGVTFLPMPDPGWWPVMADDRIPLALQPRIAVEVRPVAVDLATFAVSPAPDGVGEAAASRSEITLPFREGNAPTKTFSATNELVLGIDGKRWVDLTAVADPQLVPQPALTGKDAAGSLSIALDGGPAYDWAAGRWIAPDGEMFLVNDSEDFWRYNAPSLTVDPGRHAVRVTAHSRFARLDAVAVRLSPEVEVELLPEPQEVHGRVPLASYQGVFYDDEPVLFTLRLTNRSASALAATASFSLENYMGEESQPIDPVTIALAPGETASQALALSPAEMGRFTLTAIVDSADGQVTKVARFLRLPKLAHPRMFFREEDIPAMRARMARYPTLYRRYGDWLERMVQKEGRFPERFLPPGVTADDCAAAAPASITDPGAARNQCGWRNYELGWRLLATEFAESFVKPRSAPLKAAVEKMRGAEKVDSYVQYHHHGPFFPGVDASLLDLAPDPAKSAPKIYAQMTAHVGEMDTLPWTLVTLEEPLTPEKRALIYEIMTLENNAERYFDTHRGERGGTWWQNPYTWCHCPNHGWVLTFMFLQNLFEEPRLFEKPIFSGFLTFQRYADPFRDNAELQPNRRGPNGEPWHWILASLSRHPLEKSTYQWNEWLKAMNGPLDGDEREAVDKLMALEGISLKGPMTGAANYFVSAVSVPVALALGWYDPEAPEVRWEEIPPTAVFDTEGWVTMRSGWEANATEVTFASGVRDHTTRHKPNHFTIIKGGDYLIGTPALMTDDGNNTGAWGNSVVIGDEWREQWALNLQQPRDGEHLVINRFPPAAFTYIGRDRRLAGYKPAEGGWGGGIDLHGHTETLFMQEGRLLGYQTWPKVDYAAGDASNAWPADQVSQLERQVAFVKPDLVIVYDRVKLGPAAQTSKWIAATGSGLTAHGDTFVVKSGSQQLSGRVLLPERPVIAAPEPMAHGWVWKGQRLLEISPSQPSDAIEYLVVMRAGGGDDPLPPMEVVHSDGLAGVKLSLGGRRIEVAFNREGPVGGAAVISGDGRADRCEFREAIVDSYQNWRADPRYEKWSRDPRFSFVVPACDRQ